MRIGEIIGGVALAGLLVLLGLAITDDRRPAADTVDTSPFVFDTAAPTSVASSAGAVGATETTAPIAPSTTTAAAAPGGAPGTTAPALASTTTLIAAAGRAAIALRVLN